MRWKTDGGQVHGPCAVFCKVKEAFGGLSNMAGGYPLVVNGQTIPSSEMLYQACRFPHHAEWQQEIIEEKSPMGAKMKARKEGRRANQSRDDWEAIQVDVMRWVLRVKLAQHFERLSRLLLATGDRPIVEKSHRDPFWGAVPNDEQVLCGRNQLGRLLMELRQLVQAQPRRLTVVEPLQTEDFLLLGKPIGTVQV